MPLAPLPATRAVTSPPSHWTLVVSVTVSNVDHPVTVPDMEKVVHETGDHLAESVADEIAALIASESRLTLGLAGGSSPEPVYMRLRETDVDWEKVHVWLSDERWVPWDHDRCNGKMASETLLDHVGAHFHRPPWGEQIEAEDSAAHYEAALRSIHPDGSPDLVLLGMGDDGHTASLFPGTEALDERNRWYVANYVPEQEEMRLTATFPLLWSAKRVVFIVTGSGKAEAVRDSFAGRTPAGRVGEGEARVTWHLDAEAASLLP